MLIVDTGPLVATADRGDPDHRPCRELLERETGPLLTTAMVIAEAAFLINRQVGPDGETALYADIVSGQISVVGLATDDWVRIRELVEAYADLPLGGTDASVIAIAERLGATSIATLDHRRFRVVRPRHLSAFALLP